MKARPTSIVVGSARRAEPAKPAGCRPIVAPVSVSRAPVRHRAALTACKTGASLTSTAGKLALRAAAAAATTAISTRIVTAFAARRECARQPPVATGSATAPSRTWIAVVPTANPVRSGRAAAPTPIAARESARLRCARPSLAVISCWIPEKATSTAEAAAVVRVGAAPLAYRLPIVRAAAAPAACAMLPVVATGSAIRRRPTWIVAARVAPHATSRLRAWWAPIARAASALSRSARTLPVMTSCKMATRQPSIVAALARHARPDRNAPWARTAPAESAMRKLAHPLAATTA